MNQSRLGRYALLASVLVLAAWVLSRISIWRGRFYDEDGLVEWATTLLYLAAAAAALVRFRSHRSLKFVLLPTALVALLCALDEISFGYNWLHFQTFSIAGKRIDACHDFLDVLVHAGWPGRLVLLALAGAGAGALLAAWRRGQRPFVGYVLLFVLLVGGAQLNDVRIVRIPQGRMVEESAEMIAALALVFAVYSVQPPRSALADSTWRPRSLAA